MAQVELLVRLVDGPTEEAKNRKRGDMVSIKTLPHRGWGLEEGLPTYFVMRLDDNDASEKIKPFFQRHKPILLGANNKVLSSVRSAFRVNLDALPVVDKVAAETGNIVFKRFIEIGLINSITDKLVVLPK